MSQPLELINDTQCLVCAKPIANNELLDGKYFLLQDTKMYLCSEHAQSFQAGIQLGQMELNNKIISYLADIDDELSGYALKEKIYNLVPMARRQVASKNKVWKLKDRTPREICEDLNKIVVGQETAKNQISLAVFKHIRSIQRPTQSVVPDRFNILLLGPTGSGKTLISNTVAQSLELPFVAADATGYSPVGFQGADADTMIHDLFLKSGNVHTAERGIVFIDELDKLSTYQSQGNTRSESLNSSTQGSLLKLVEGKKVKVPGPIFGEPMGTFTSVDTSKMLFIFGGAFPGLAEIVGKLSGYDGRKISLTNRNHDNELEKAIKSYDILSSATPDMLVAALIEYGLSAELVGRIPVLVPLAPLNQTELRACLTDLDHSPVVRETRLFAECGYILEFEEEFLDSVVEIAHKMATGTRALKTLVTEAVKVASFELLGGASDVNKRHVIIGKECLKDPSKYRVGT